MLRVGLTGGLGSGKSTAANMFAALGAHILSSDEIGRELMLPGEPVHGELVRHFGPGIVRVADGTLDRAALARIAFEEGRVDELNAIIHPAVIQRQTKLTQEIAAREPAAIILVESALIFETKYGDGPGGWNKRFDKLILVTAPEELRVQRFIERAHPTEDNRAGLEAEAYRRMAQQIPEEQKAALCDYVLTNSGSLRELEWQVDKLWPLLLADSQRP